MRCEKCGNKLEDGDFFCINCGTRVQQETEPTQPEAAQAETASQYDRTVASNSEQAAQTPEQSSETVGEPNQQIPNQGFENGQGFGQQMPVQIQKKPMSPKTKKIIAISVVGAAAVAAILIVLFTVILPIFNRVDMSKYVKLTFSDADSISYSSYTDYDDVTLYNGQFSARADIDTETMIEEKSKSSDSEDDTMGKVLSGEYNINDLLEDIDGFINGSNSIDDYCKVTMSVKGKKASDTNIVNNLKKDDVLVVSIKWDISPDEEKDFAELEKELGLSFDRGDKTVEFKVSDELKKNKIECKEITEVDLLDYLEKNSIAYFTGVSDGNIMFSVKPFEYEKDGCKFVLSEDSNNIEVTCDGNNASLSIYAYPGSYLSDGDNVTLELTGDIQSDTNMISDMGVRLSSVEKKYTAKAQQVATLDEVKENIDKISEQALKTLDDNFNVWLEKDIFIEQMYYLLPKNDDAKFKSRLACVYKRGDEYGVALLENATLVDGVLGYDKLETDWIAKKDSAKNAVKDSDALNDKNYTSEKVK